jgi:hypothetical protein
MISQQPTQRWWIYSGATLTGMDATCSRRSSITFNTYSNGDRVVVGLGVTSRCDLPDEWMYNDTFDFYAGNSIAFWQWSYLSELERFVRQPH